jgi:hypothetical protein
MPPSDLTVSLITLKREVCQTATGALRQEPCFASSFEHITYVIDVRHRIFWSTNSKLRWWTAMMDSQSDDGQ